ncbi:MAG: DUF2007 domain-containing protein [Chloroflexota bacterium]|nr:DUF2007 domain-containing protein [Chloroflexota bacterium]MDE2686709.1 DUF2007 domain-containing protein [Chloroflexota bacterium]MYC06713.1 DUF2007 domain-containing protein [Chloroflexota bacterium]
MPADNTTVEFATYPNEMEAQMVAQLLRENGIGAFVQPLGFGYGGVGTFQFIPHRVLVYEHNLERAQGILDADADWEDEE